MLGEFLSVKLPNVECANLTIVIILQKWKLEVYQFLGEFVPAWCCDAYSFTCPPGKCKEDSGCTTLKLVFFRFYHLLGERVHSTFNPCIVEQCTRPLIIDESWKLPVRGLFGGPYHSRHPHTIYGRTVGVLIGFRWLLGYLQQRDICFGLKKKSVKGNEVSILQVMTYISKI